jgi:septum formation topological specificity factor MinE
MSGKREKQRMAFARFQEKKKQRKNELETRLNTLIYYSSGSSQDNDYIPRQENEILQRQCVKLERENELMKRSVAQLTPPTVYFQVPQTSAIRPVRIDTLSIPVSAPMIMTPETAFAKEILDIILAYSPS